MQRSGPSKVIACLPLLIGLLLQLPPAASQAPVKQPVKKAFNPDAKRPQQTYVPPPTTQAVLTLTANNPVAIPNQIVNFTLTWDRTVVHASYHFDWGDKTPGTDTTTPAATYRYAAPGVYHVRVTATPILSAARMMVLKPSQVPTIQSNEVTIAVQEPVQPPPTKQPPPTTVALTADRTSVIRGEPVNFTASLYPLSPAAQFHFDFGDGNTVDTASNLAAHNYFLPGPHLATVAVADANGNQQASSPPVEVTVLEPIPRTPVVQLIPSFRGPVATGQPISVRAILKPPTGNTGFEFDWGDGTPPQTVNDKGIGIHTYTKPGSMEVIVTALNETYLPPLQSSLHVQVTGRNWWPPSPGTMAIAGGALIVIAVIGWLTFKLVQKIVSKIVLQRFRYQVSGGLSQHKLQMVGPSSDIGPFKLSSGMGPEEHRIKFPGRADTSN